MLITETGGLVARESPEAVMAEIEFRATHLSSLLEEMLEEATKRDEGESGEP